MLDKICCCTPFHWFSPLHELEAAPAPPQPQPETGSSSINSDAYLDSLIEYISQLFEVIHKANRDSKKKPREESTRSYKPWPTDSEGLEKLEKFLSAGIDFASDLSDDIVKGDVKNVLEGIAHASLATAGLLIVVYVLERFEKVSANKTACLSLLKEMSRLAIVIKQFKESDRLKERMDNEITEAIELIAEGSRMCGAQITSSKFAEFFSSSSNAKALSEFEVKLDNMYTILNTHLGIHILKAIDCKGGLPSRRCPDTVGIEKSIKDVLNLLEWGTEKNVVAVIIYGYGGLGKTTLAQAIFSRIDIKTPGCKYSKVELFKNIESKPDIGHLQKQIYRDLKGHEAVDDFRIGGDGQLLLNEVLKEVPAFIYIDNVLGAEELSLLLPSREHMKNAKKVRLLITARDLNIDMACPVIMPPKKYCMEGLSYEDSMILFKNKVTDEKVLVKELKPDQFNKIINICSGIPLMIDLVAGAFCSKQNKQDVYDRVMEEMEGLEGETLEHNEYGFQILNKANIGRFFAYDTLPPGCKDAFLDICFYFKDWDWDTVTDIVGKYELETLQSRALLTKDANRLVNVHDVILRISHLIMSSRKEEGMRLKFTNASELMEFLNDKDIENMGIKGMWLTGNRDLEHISASKLDLMHRTLRVFALESKTEVDGDCQKGFEELVFFKAKAQRLPFVASKSKKLRYLSSNSEDLILPEMPSSLRHLELYRYSNLHAFQISPTGLQQLMNLRILRLIGFVELENLPSMPGDLQELTLSYCKRLKELPDISNLQYLKVLTMNYCSSLGHLPKVLGSLSSLRELNLRRCENLEKLEESIGDLKCLSSLLDMSYCGLLVKLPDRICSLSLITHLSLQGCKSLERLPKDFGRLVCLVDLNLSQCSKLQELCDGFNSLSSLRRLDLSGCGCLQNLPKDFHILASLQYLNLSYCSCLKEECMHTVVQIKALEIVNIRQTMLESTWVQIEVDNKQSFDFMVVTQQSYSSESNSKHIEDILQRMSSKLHPILRDAGGRPFHLSALRPDTLVLFIFDCYPVFQDAFPWRLIEETEGNTTGDFDMIYVGNHFNKLPKKVANGFLAHGPDNSDARGLFHSAVVIGLNALGPVNPGFDHYLWDTCFQMSTKVVEDSKGVKYLSRWEFLLPCQVENMFFCRGKKYSMLKALAETPQHGNIPLLRELFGGKEDKDIFLKNGRKHEAGIHELEGKNILLEIRHAHADACGNDMLYGSLIEMYKLREEKGDFEIISIIIGDQSTVGKFVSSVSREVPWLVLQNPRIVTGATRYFLAEDCPWYFDGETLESYYPSRIRIIEPNGRVPAFKYALSMMERWDPKACLFTDKKTEELRIEEWNQLKTMSNLEFIFMHLETISDQVKEVIRQGKMICLYGLVGDWMEAVTGLINNLLLKLRDNIHIIHVPVYDRKRRVNLQFTYGTVAQFFRWEKPAMPPQVQMEGTAFVNLSKHDAMRLWRRIFYLSKEIDEIHPNPKTKQLEGMARLLDSFGYQFATQIPCMILVDGDGEMVILWASTIVKLFDNKNQTKKLMELLSSSFKKERMDKVNVFLHEEVNDDEPSSDIEEDESDPLISDNEDEDEDEDVPMLI